MKAFISNVFIILALIALIALIVNFFKALKSKEWKKVIKNFLFFIVLGILGGATAPNDASSSSTKSKTENVKKASVKKHTIKKDNSNKQSKSSNNNPNVNADISSTLTENKSYAQDGNNDFQFANYINDIKYTGGTDVTVNVNNDFMNLPDDQKKQVLDKVQSSVGSTLLMDNKISNDDYKQGLFLTINLGGNSVGHSKLTDNHEYKFFKQN